MCFFLLLSFRFDLFSAFRCCLYVCLCVCEHMRACSRLSFCFIQVFPSFFVCFRTRRVYVLPQRLNGSGLFVLWICWPTCCKWQQLATPNICICMISQPKIHKKKEFLQIFVAQFMRIAHFLGGIAISFIFNSRCRNNVCMHFWFKGHRSNQNWTFEQTAAFIGTSIPQSAISNCMLCAYVLSCCLVF